jgi:hypothetical protein
LPPGGGPLPGLNDAERRFPPPWSVEDIDAAFVVKDGSGQKLGYFYYEEELGRRSSAKLGADHFHNCDLTNNK